MLSISTSWHDAKVQSISDWIKQVKEMGLNAVELSYKVTRQQYQEAKVAIKENDMQVSSIHNFCPMPDDEPSDRHPSNYYRLSSQDEHERKQAMKWTKIAVDTAKEVNASVVVIHAGTIDLEDPRTPELFQLYVDGKKDSQEFADTRQRILDHRQSVIGDYIAALDASLKDVCQYAHSQNITIGLETRYYPIEIPNFEEIKYFLDKFSSKGMKYWHDVGHAEMNDRLGIRAHLDFLESYKDSLIGVHIHGFSGRRDHQGPFVGDMDLEKLLPYFGENVLRVIESKPMASKQEIIDSIPRLQN